MHKKVLDIAGASEKSGAKVIVWPKKHSEACNIDIAGIKLTLNDARNQHWYFDANGIVRSALNDFALTAKNPGDQAVMMPFNGQPSQQWRLFENRFMKNQQECLSVARADRKDGAPVLTQCYKGSVYQHWHIEYV